MGMAFKKRDYKIYKKWMDEQLSHGFYLNPAVYTSLPADDHFGTCVDMARSIFTSMVKAENWEAAKAVSDSVRDFFAKFGHPIPEDATLKLKEPRNSEDNFHGHISLGDPDDPTGMGSGGAVNF